MRMCDTDHLTFKPAHSTVLCNVSAVKAALWAAELPALRLCDFGVDDRQDVLW